ncbi:NADH:flavin oxidoreductase/NADH oxidase [Prochlorococcus marinus]|uniref:NADH:flavin oxidoreductase/NADH oxidase n=1 Tax=Prochlorococcus marinus TaxID=1219 RepID=UPI0022B5A612|nr:NADH:flavin oxidoreductase/NADH oxidase [Prochlorococcus marinus]
MTTNLFTPINLSGQYLKNRLVVAPMCQYSSSNGEPSAWHRRHLGTLALSGAGMLMIESTAVSMKGRISSKDLVLENDDQVIAFSNLLKEIKTLSDIPISLQISHAGRKGSVNVPWEKNGTSLDKYQSGWETVSASSIARDKGWQKPRQMNIDEINKTVNDFELTTKKACLAGFQGVEVHMAHGYLLHQFLSPISNKRKDQFGGDFLNRCRFPLQVIEKVREVLPREKILGVRLTGDDCLNGGWTINDCIRLAHKLKTLGVSYLCISSGGILPITKLKFGPCYQVHLAEKVKSAVQIPVRTAGMITTPKQANDIIKNGKADMVALGRQFIRDPWFAIRAANELSERFIMPNQYKRCLP